MRNMRQIRTGKISKGTDRTERRRYERLKRRIAMTFMYEGEEYVAETVDVSKTGALFVSKEAPSPGTRLLLNMVDRHNPALSIFIKATVVRVLPGKKKGQKLFAVEFGDLIARDPRRLRMFLEQVLNISTGLIRVVGGEPGEEKAYAFSFDIIQKEGAERLQALQTALFSSHEEMDEADAILANFGKGFDTRLPEAKGGADRDESGKTDVMIQSGVGETVSMKGPTVLETPTITSSGIAPKSTASQAKLNGYSANKETLAGVERSTNVKIQQRARIQEGGGEAALAEKPGTEELTLEEGVLGSPKPEKAEKEEGERGEPSLEGPGGGAKPSIADTGGRELSVPVVAPSTGQKTSLFKRLASLFSLTKTTPKGEGLIRAGPVPNIAVGDLELPIVCRVGSTRFQGTAVRLYCAGLKCTTEEKLPQLYSNLTVLIPLTGAKKISQIELNGDVTRVKPHKSDSEFGGVFEVRLSMRTDKMHLELYRTLLEKLVASSEKKSGSEAS